jgi:beta-1,4-mannosyl-glycoprotein beta-1,4-N-acetylglucosaminyltransferase
VRVFDCFCFFNELDLLEIRLTELDPVVDVFVIVECTRTWKNVEKPLTFQANAARFDRWRDRIRYVVQEEITDLSPADRLHRSKRPESDARRREWFQRDRIGAGLTGTEPNDLIMVSDLDEIPRREIIRKIKSENLQKKSVIFLEQPQYSGNLNWYVGPSDWIGTRMVEKKYFRSAQLLRLTKARGHAKAMHGTKTLDWWARTLLDFRVPIRPRRIADAGWHFSTIGSAAEVSYKAAQHIEAVADRPEIRDAAAIERLRHEKKSHLGLQASGVPLAAMPIAVREHPERYRHLLDPDFL